MSDCERCGYANQEGIAYCARCGAQLRLSDEETRCVEYILGEIPQWLRQGIIPAGSAARLERLYRGRLANRVPAPPVVPPAADQPATVPPEPQFVPSATTPAPSLGEFLEAHWLKLLAALAAAFILAGVRQVMGVAWLEQVGILLLPCVPLFLSAALIRFGLKNAQAKSVGARACGGIGIAMAAFVVTSVTHRWLGDALPHGWALALACIASSAVAAGVLRATGDRTYGHYVLAFGTLAAPLLAMASMETLSPQRPSPWHLGAALALAGCLHLGVAVVRFRSGPGDRDVRRDVAYVWGLIALGGAAMLCVMDAAVRGPESVPAILTLAACAAVTGVVARMVGSSELVASTIGATALTGFFVVTRDLSAGLVEYGLLAGSLGILWSALATASGGVQSPSGQPIGRGYHLASLAAFGAAGTLLAVRLVGWLGGDRPAFEEWPRMTILAALCGSAYAVASPRLRQPTVMLASAAAWVTAIAIAAHRYLPSAIAGLAHESGHDLVIAGLAAIATTAFIHRFRSSVVSEGVWPVTWYGPWAYVASVVGVLGVTNLVVNAVTAGDDLGKWTGILGMACAFLAAAIVLGKGAEPAAAQCLMGAGLGTLSAAAGLSGRALMPEGGATVGLMAAAWVLAMTARWAESSATLWRVPATAVGIGAFAAMLASVPAVEPLRSVQVLAIGAGVLGLSATIGRGGHPLSSGMSACALGAAWVISLASGVDQTESAGYLAILSLICAAAYGRAAWQGFAPAAWMSSVTAALTCFGIVRWFGVTAEWTLIAMLPGLTAVFALGETAIVPGVLRSPLRQTAVLAALMGIVGHEVLQIAVLPEPDHRAAVLSIGASAMLLIAGTVRRGTGPWCLAACGATSLGAAHACDIVPAEGSVWAVRYVLCAVPYLLVLFAARTNARLQSMASEITICAAVHAFAAYGVGLVAAGTPDQGLYSVLAIVLAGTVAASLFAVGRGSAFAHAAVGAFLTAYALYMYSRIGIAFDVLDLYMIPVGLYLLLLGHLSDRAGARDERGADGSADRTQALWWTGLMVMVFPTFAAFLAHFQSGTTPIHAILLVAECVGAILWGIAHRIRAFVIVGSTFALAFAVVLGSASAGHFIVGAVALTVGLVMLAAVYRLGSRAAETRAWLGGIRDQWKRWK